MKTIQTLLSKFNLDYFFATPPDSQIVNFWFASFVAFLLVILIIYIYLRLKGRKITPYKKYAKGFFWPNFTFDLIGLVFIFARYEKLAFLSYRFWIYITLLFIIVFNAYYFMIKRSQLEDEVLRFHNSARKNKWLKKK